MKRSGGHRIPGLNCCGQGRMCYRWSKRYCWGDRAGDAMCSPGTQKSPFVFLSKKICGRESCFFYGSHRYSGLKGLWATPCLTLLSGGFFLLFWSSQKGHVTPEKIWDFLELTEMVVTSQTAPSFPCCESMGGSVPSGGNVAGDLPQAGFSLVFWASLPQFTVWKSINWSTLWTASGQDQIRCDLQH